MHMTILESSKLHELDRRCFGGPRCLTVVRRGRGEIRKRARHCSMNCASYLFGVFSWRVCGLAFCSNSPSRLHRTSYGHSSFVDIHPRTSVLIPDETKSRPPIERAKPLEGHCSERVLYMPCRNHLPTNSSAIATSMIRPRPGNGEKRGHNLAAKVGVRLTAFDEQSPELIRYSVLTTIRMSPVEDEMRSPG
jgi:hypothetical protein